MTEVRLIRPPGKWPSLNLREILFYRELIWVFVKRGISSRYRQMALGITWSFLEPLGLLLLMSIVFGYLIRVPTEGYPFTVFVATALIPWMYFSKATNAAANSLHEQLSIISKIYFPRVIIPVSAVVREFFDLLVLFVILMLLNLGFGYWPTWRMVLMPLLLVYITLPALGVGLAVSSISVKYRDFRPLLTIALQAGFTRRRSSTRLNWFHRASCRSMSLTRCTGGCLLALDHARPTLGDYALAVFLDCVECGGRHFRLLCVRHLRAGCGRCAVTT